MNALHLGDDGVGDLRELGVGGMEHRCLAPGGDGSGPGEVQQIDSVERPAVRPARVLEVGTGLGERHVKTALASLQPGLHELKCDRGLPRTRVTLEQVKARTEETAEEHVVEPFDAGVDHAVWNGRLPRRIRDHVSRPTECSHESNGRALT